MIFDSSFFESIHVFCFFVLLEFSFCFSLAGSLAAVFSAILSTFFDVGNKALESGQLTGMWQLTLVAAGINMIGLLLVKFLPRNSAEQVLLTDDRNDLCFVLNLFVNVSQDHELFGLFVFTPSVFMILCVCLSIETDRRSGPRTICSARAPAASLWAR